MIRAGILTGLFVGTVVAANWALETFHLIPVGFGLMAPAGVLFAGLAFGLRDALQEAAGDDWRWWIAGAIVAGTIVSVAVSPQFALASGTAFALSELLDFAVYQPLRERHWPVAVAASNVVGAVVDSAVFLWLAFGTLAYMPGQVVGKTYMVAVALPVVWWMRRRREDVEPELVAA